ncbi:MAG: acyltransferase domain-containing protein, partial [Pseudomonadota bacterium]
MKTRSRLVGTAVNADGATNGLPLPSSARQAELIDGLIERTGMDADKLAMIEAHGTGTHVGDPREATAIGKTYGARRAEPLPVGSAKANFGHLEPAAGLTGLLRAQLCLENQHVPASAFDTDLNPDIDFDALNLRGPDEALDLPPCEDGWLAAVNSFGFGGANAHALLQQTPTSTDTVRDQPFPPSLLLTAQTRAALENLARAWRSAADADGPDLVGMVATANRRLARHRHRVCLRAGSAIALERELADWLEGTGDTAEVAGAAHQIAFVFSGNGSAWAGMARDAFADPSFRTRFREAAQAFDGLGIENIESLLFDGDLDEKLSEAAVSQPLIFAIQIAVAQALADRGIRPAATLGHSAGECAAAVVAGRLSVEEGARIIASRSFAFEALRDTGEMAALNCSREDAEELLKEIAHPLDISAQNAPRNVTVSGSSEGIHALTRLARKRRISSLKLAIAYPYHSRYVDLIENELTDRLGEVACTNSSTRFYSGWMGALADTTPLDAHYWQRNARHEVAFMNAVRAMLDDGIEMIVEIGPRSVLQGNIKEILKESASTVPVLQSLERGKSRQSTPASVARRILEWGGVVDEVHVLGPLQTHSAPTPDYPFDHDEFRPELTDGFASQTGPFQDHPLLGRRNRVNDWVWHGALSTARLPWLSSHAIKDEATLPAMAMLEMFRAAARDVANGNEFELVDIQLQRPVALGKQATDLEMRYDPGTWLFELSIVEPEGRRRVAKAELRTEVAPITGHLRRFSSTPADGLYNALSATGLTYGSEFQRVTGLSVSGEIVDVNLSTASRDEPVEDFVCSADALLHGVAVLGEYQVAHVPYRIDRAVFASDLSIVRGQVDASLGASKGLCVTGADADGRVVLRMDGVRLARLPAVKRDKAVIFEETLVPVTASEKPVCAGEVNAFSKSLDAAPTDRDVLRGALAGRLAWDLVFQTSNQHDTGRRAFAESWLSELGVVEIADGSAVAAADCPWPEIPKLIELLCSSSYDCADELHATLADIKKGEALGARATSRGPKTAVDLLEKLTGRIGRVLLVGNIDEAVLDAALCSTEHVTLAAASASDLEHMLAQVGSRHGFAAATYADLLDAGSFDLVIGISVLSNPAATATLAKLTQHATETVLIDEAPDAFAILSGLYDDYQAFSAALGPFGHMQRVAVDGDDGLVLHLGVAEPTKIQQVPLTARVLGKSEFAEQIARELPITTSGQIICVLPDNATHTDRLSGMQRCVEELAAEGTAWVIDPSADNFGALAGLRRVVHNETKRDIRVIAVEHSVTAKQISDIVAQSKEAEIIVRNGGLFAPRFRPIEASATPYKSARRVLKPVAGDASRTVKWREEERHPPQAGEVEIAVEATGVNFRDIMLSEGALPDEAFLGGYAGRNLGLECSGRISRVGAGCSLEIGTPVAAFAAGAFASHVTVPEEVVFPLPNTMNYVEGATLPVAFLTADYALHHCARLTKGESVLIHGGAGGVGLAAIQIAKAKGLRIFATAGSPEKREFLSTFGLDGIFDSRSLTFV